MSHRHVPHSDDPKVQAYIDKITKRDRTVDHLFRRLLHFIERSIAVITIVALLAALGLEIYEMFTMEGYFREVDHLLHNLLTIVVGLEFVRMLIDTTPANILEVLTVAIARHIIISHEDPFGLLIGIVCLAGIFAVRRFLIRHKDMQVELSKAE